jgi:hypothetical protein
VLVVDGIQLAESPEKTLPGIMKLCRLPFEESLLKQLITHPSINKHSKHRSMFYDAESRRQEMADLDIRYAREVDKAITWTASRGLEDTSYDAVAQWSAHI